ncbi:MAG: hypothetical protein Q4D38_08060 [Planctomycetia bacterium]|nr:hypothetical protein [Planctomycetia bacterium]
MITNGFLDIFRKLLGWKSVSYEELPIALRLKLPPDGMAHSTGAEKAVVHSF